MEEEQETERQQKSRDVKYALEFFAGWDIEAGDIDTLFKLLALEVLFHSKNEENWESLTRKMELRNSE